MQILKSYVELHDKDLRVLEVNWLKEDIKGMKYRQSRITRPLPIEKLCLEFLASY